MLRQFHSYTYILVRDFVSMTADKWVMCLCVFLEYPLYKKMDKF